MILENSLTIPQAIESPTLRTVFKGGNSQICFSVIEVLVIRFLESFGFSSKPTKNQIEFITSDALDKFSYESLYDVILFFSMARKGDFGTTSRGVDSNLIFGEWYPKYMEKKSIEREKIIEKEKSNKKKDFFSIEKVQETYAVISKRNESKLKKIKEQRVVDYVERITETMDRQILEDTIMDWERDKEKKPYVSILKRKRQTIK